MNLTELAQLQGIHLQTAYRWLGEGTLPVPAVRVNSWPVLVAPDAVIAPAQGGIGLCARASCHDLRAGLDRQVTRPDRVGRTVRPCRRAGRGGGPVLDERSSKAWRLLAGPGAQTVVAGHRDRLGG